MDRNDLRVICAFWHGNQIIFNDSDDKEDDEVSKLEGYAEETVPRLRDRQFKEHFRMLPSTFEDLLNKLHNNTLGEERNIKGRPELPLEKQAMVTLWCLANSESFLSVATRFGLVKSTCWEVLYRTCRRLLQANERYKIVCWPTRERAVSIMEAFQRLSGFPGIHGLIDGSHIEILAPTEHPNSYYNRNKYHSILLQAVCDQNKLFTHVYVGEPGSIHDQRLLEKSDLYEAIVDGTVRFEYEGYLLGDLAYKLTPYLMVGFKDNGNLTNQQKYFNHRLSTSRVIIENALGLLKGRFRRLKRLDTQRLDLICLLVVAACIMHNVCILNGDMADDLVNLEAEVERERENNEVVPYNAGQQNQIAIAKRQQLMQHFL